MDKRYDERIVGYYLVDSVFSPDGATGRDVVRDVHVKTGWMVMDNYGGA